MRTKLFTRKAVRAIPAAFFVCLIFVSQVQAGSCTPPPSAEPVSIAKVYDGDTVKLDDGRKVRLLGINTPEMNHRDSSLPPDPWAEQASEALTNFINSSKGIWLSTDRDKKDYYGRTLAHLWNDQGESASSVLLRMGLAQQVVFPPNLLMVECYRASENLARSNRLGLWQQEISRLETLAYPGTGFQLLAVEVTEVQKKGETWWVELKGPLVLKLSALKSGFSTQAIQAMPGKRFLVRGWVKARSHSVVQQGFKPYLMQLQHPMMIEQLK